MNCLYCGEVLAPEDDIEEIANGSLHRECLIRMSQGSAAHQLKECYCFGGTRRDPPGLCTRDSAKLALEVFTLLREKEKPS